MTWRTTLAELATDHRARRRFVLVTATAWLLLSLAAGGGLVQYAPDGWIVPVRTWIAYAQPTPYGFYAPDAHWALVPVPLYLAQALGVAVLAGAHAAVSTRARRCRLQRAPRGVVLGGVGGLIGALGAAACCSPLALLLAALLGSSAAATLTGIGLWVPAGIFTLGIAIETRRLLSPRAGP